MKLKITTLNKSAFVLALLALCGCESRNSLQKLDAGKLQALARECRAAPPSAPGQIIACQNIARECTRRADSGVGNCR